MVGVVVLGERVGVLVELVDDVLHVQVAAARVEKVVEAAANKSVGEQAGLGADLD